MTQIGDDYYDMSTVSAVGNNNYSLDIVSGLSLSIEPRQAGMLLEVDVSHKLLRGETAWHIIGNLGRQSGQQLSQDDIRRALYGAVILTRYDSLHDQYQIAVRYMYHMTSGAD